MKAFLFQRDLDLCEVFCVGVFIPGTFAQFEVGGGGPWDLVPVAPGKAKREKERKTAEMKENSLYGMEGEAISGTAHNG